MDTLTGKFFDVIGLLLRGADRSRPWWFGCGRGEDLEFEGGVEGRRGQTRPLITGLVSQFEGQGVFSGLAWSGEGSAQFHEPLIDGEFLGGEGETAQHALGVEDLAESDPAAWGHRGTGRDQVGLQRFRAVDVPFVPYREPDYDSRGLTGLRWGSFEGYLGREYILRFE